MLSAIRPWKWLGMTTKASSDTHANFPGQGEPPAFDHPACGVYEHTAFVNLTE